MKLLPFLQTARIALAAGLAANALAMLLTPHRWYQSVPGVASTGAYNPHFVRDIGCAYLVAALGIGLHAWRREWRPAALAGAGFLVLHAGVHVGELIAGQCGSARFLADVPGVVGPAVLALWLAQVGHPKSHRA